MYKVKLNHKYNFEYKKKFKAILKIKRKQREERKFT